MLECPFCQEESKRAAILRLDHCYVIYDRFPVSKGHALIIPYDHVEHWFMASEALQIEMVRALNLVKLRLDSELKPDGYNVGLNCGAAAGQTVPHLHLHCIPRTLGDMEDPRGGVRGVIPSRQKY